MPLQRVLDRQLNAGPNNPIWKFSLKKTIIFKNSAGFNSIFITTSYNRNFALARNFAQSDCFSDEIYFIGMAQDLEKNFIKAK